MPVLASSTTCVWSKPLTWIKLKLERVLWPWMTAFPVECEGDASPLASVRGRRTPTRLDPDLYPDRPDVTFVLQYFKQPANIAPLAEYYHSCTAGRLGDAATGRAAQLFRV